MNHLSFLSTCRRKDKFSRSMFFSSLPRNDQPSGKASNTKFSWLKVKTLYIPQQSTYGDRFPLLLTDSSNLTQEYVGWKDELESYEEYCVLFDIRELAEMVKSERNEDEEKVLGSVNYWPPGK